MITLPGHFIFAATPRTGSRAISKALLTIEGASRWKDDSGRDMHHVHPEELAGKTNGLPIYSVIRCPYDQTLSWFYHAIVRHDPVMAYAERFHTFIREAYIGWFFNQRLNPYHEISTKIFLYQPELSGVVRSILRESGLDSQATQIEEPETIGKSVSLDKKLIDSQARELVNERFKEDIRLYKRILKQEGLQHDSKSIS